ncbi:MAG: toprim domain-containing protein, partial [Erysipelotrichaceae bacterium]
MKLIIAEKPDLAQDIAKAILKDTKKENGIYKNDEYTIVSSYGHLLSLAEPEAYDERYKKWSLEDLPIYFENWKRVPGEEQYKKERLKLIGSLISNA